MKYDKPYENKPGEGSAFFNDRKTEDWHDDYRGKILLPNGKTHWFGVQPKTTQDGKTFYKVKIGKEFTSKPVQKEVTFNDLPDDDPF